MVGPVFRTKSLLFLIILPVLFTFVVYLGYIEAKQQYYAAGVKNLEIQMNTIQHLLNVFRQDVQEGRLTEQQAQEQAKEILSGPKRPDGTRDLTRVDITLGADDYIFVLAENGLAILHPQLEGQNLYDVKNDEGRFVTRDILSQKEGIIRYTWKNPGDLHSRMKIAYLHYDPEWKWYIGISTYEENFYHLFDRVRNMLIFLVAGSYIITAILFILTNRKEKALRLASSTSVQLTQTNQSILKSLAVALEERDSYTSGHSKRVAYYMRHIAKQMGYTEDELEVIYTGGLLHDIGKIGVEDRILFKPGKLTEQEYELIKQHPVRGEALLRRLYMRQSRRFDKDVNMILSITRSHHERFDGRGYPDQLKGEQIPLIARIAAVADAFDAMTSNRAYRRGLSYSKACQEIQDHSGTQFCPVVVVAFLQSITEEIFLEAHQTDNKEEWLLEQMGWLEAK